jgi:hypothetical protein
VVDEYNLVSLTTKQWLRKNGFSLAYQWDTFSNNNSNPGESDRNTNESLDDRMNANIPNGWDIPPLQLIMFLTRHPLFRNVELNATIVAI